MRGRQAAQTGDIPLVGDCHKPTSFSNSKTIELLGGLVRQKVRQNKPRDYKVIGRTMKHADCRSYLQLSPLKPLPQYLEGIKDR